MPSSKRQKPKVVIDSNVWISAIIWGGHPAKIVKAAENGKLNILLSPEIISELNRILNYERLKTIYEKAELSREEIITKIVQTGKIIDKPIKLPVVHEDPTDNKFIECAVTGKADYIISGDTHLLRIKQYKKIKILPPKDFLKLIEG